jgi:hypothetical protein
MGAPLRPTRTPFGECRLKGESDFRKGQGTSRVRANISCLYILLVSLLLDAWPSPAAAQTGS